MLLPNLPVIEAIPAAPGGYILELSLASTTEIISGRFSGVVLAAGVYLYAGSACGPGGLRGRLSRHARPVESIRLHWHIDHLRRVAVVQRAAWLATAEAVSDNIECRWAQALHALPGAAIPLPGFGSSDCRRGCRAHLIGFPVTDEILPSVLGRLCAAAGAAENALQMRAFSFLVGEQPVRSIS